MALTAANELCSDDILSCTKILMAGSDTKPQFIVRVLVNGEWADALVDTGATISFISSDYAGRKCKELITLAKTPLTIRLGDNRTTRVSHKITTCIRCEERDTEGILYVMPKLPIGIDIILGKDWQSNADVLLHPRTNRVAFASKPDGATTATAIEGTEGDSNIIASARPIGIFLPKKKKGAASKADLDAVYKIDGCNVHSDLNVVSKTTFDRYLNKVERGNLSYADTEAQVSLAHLDTNGIIGAHVRTGRSKRGTADTLERDKQRRDLKRRVPEGAGIFARPQSRPSSPVDEPVDEKISDCDQSGCGQIFTKNVNPHTIVPPEAETVWLAHVIVDESGTATLNFPGMDIHEELKRPVAQTAKDEVCARADIDSGIKLTPPQGQLKTPINYATGERVAMEKLKAQCAERILPECILPRAEINATAPAYKSWVKDLTDGKHGDFKCFKPVEKFEPTPGDEPMKVELKEGAKVPSPQRYRAPQNLLVEFKKFIIEMLEKGWIEPAKDAVYAAPVLIIKKPGTYEDGSSKGYRFCTDFRGLNSVVKPLRHHIPDIYEMWDHLKEAKFISVCDMKHGYFNAPVHEDSRRFLAMQTPWGVHSYRCVPMGFINSSFYFQRWLERKLRKHGMLYEPVRVHTGEDAGEGHDPTHSGETENQKDGTSSQAGVAYRGCVLVYQDDIVVFSGSAEQHKRDILRLMQVLSEENVPLNIKKSCFFAKYVRYLGAVLGDGKIFTDPDKVQAMVDLKVDPNLKSIRGFLGMTGFYRRWISGYASYAKPLTDLLKKGVNIASEWGAAQNEAVLDLKKALMSYPVLQQPKQGIPFVIASDASDYATGAVLGQVVDGKMVAIAYTSGALRGPEKNYSVQEKEALGVIRAVKAFNHYILASPFEIRLLTDHQSLKFLHTQKGLAGRMARWAMLLAEYSATVKYLKGSENHVADALSRLIDTPSGSFNTSVSLLTLHANVHAEVKRVLVKRGIKEGITAGMENSSVHENFCAMLGPDFESVPGENDSDIGDAKIAAFHEQILFGSMGLRAHSNFKITAENYQNCKFFGPIYRSLMSDEKGSQKNSSSTKKKKRKTDDAEKEMQPHTATLERYFIEDSILYWSDKKGGELVAVPNGDDNVTRRTILKECHDSDLCGHRGVHATQNKIRSRFYWPQYSKEVAQYVETCEICKTTKSERRKPQGLLQPLDIPLGPYTHYAMDFKTDLPESGNGIMGPYDTLLVVVDRFSKWIALIPTWKKASAALTAELIFDKIVAHRGLPHHIVSDRDPKFTSNLWRSLWERTGTILHLSTARHQSTDGLSEINIRIVEEVLRGSLNYKMDNWVSKCSSIEFALNNSISTPIGCTPHYVERGVAPTEPLDLSDMFTKRRLKSPPSQADQLCERIFAAQQQARDNLEKARLTMSRNADTRRRVTEDIKPGSKCYLKLEGIELDRFKLRPCAKLNPLKFGPLDVIRKVSPVSYELALPVGSDIHPVFHVDRLSLFKKGDTVDGRSRSRAFPETEARTYEIECIMDEKRKRGHTEFLVHWKGYSQLFDSTWEPAEKLQRTAKSVIKKWRTKNPAIK